MADSKSVKTPRFRVSFPHVFEPQDVKKDDGSTKKEFSIVALFPKGTDLSALKAEANRAAKEKWGDKIPKNLASPFHDQGEKEYVGYESGAIFIRAKSTVKPGVVGQEVVNGKFAAIDSSEFSPGCYAWMSVNAYAYGGPGTKFNPGVAFGLRNIQKLEDGDPLGNRSRAEDDFAAPDGGAGEDIFGGEDSAPGKKGANLDDDIPF